MDTRQPPRPTAEYYRSQLYTNTLPFWLAHGVDHEYGGIFTGLHRDGTRIETDKSVWFQGRAAWTFATAYEYSDQTNPAYLDAARSAIEFSDRFCYDTADGRMLFRVTRDGAPLIKRRYFFSECFAACAKAAWARVTGDSAANNEAFELLSKVIAYQTNPTMSTPKINPETRASTGLSLPMIEIHVAQEIRDAAVLLEGPDSDLAVRCTDIVSDRIARVERLLVKDDLQCVLEQAGDDGTFLRDHFEGRLLNPGHSIEFAWFVLREADYTNDTTLRELGCRILDWMLDRGWDREFGGFFYFLDALGYPPFEYWHNMKFWWPHNEAIIACLYAAVLSPEGGQRSGYMRWFERIHEWNESHFPDREHGEWFGYLNRDGSVSTQLKGNMFKGPYHIPRMQLYAWQLLSRLG